MDPAEDLPAIRAGDVIGGGADVERMVLDDEDEVAAQNMNGYDFF